MSFAIEIDAIRAARKRAAGFIKTTPLEHSGTFSALCGCDIYLKLENLQKTGSFKVRGALNKIQQLSDEQRRQGVITASAGNHAQGVAYAGRISGVPVAVVMPRLATFSKVLATEGYGAEVIPAGNDYAEAFEHAAGLARERNATFVHAFDDAEVITGQGTVGLEILEQLPAVDTIVVPVGGGGLLAGILAAVRGVGSAAQVVAVQAEGAAALAGSLLAGAPTACAVTDTIADGLATRTIGRLPLEIIAAARPQVVEMSDADIAAAVLLLLERTKTVVEAAGAAALAACLGGQLPAGVKKVAVVLSGGNIDMNLLDRIINLGLATQGRLFRFSTRVGDQPGQLQRLVAVIAQENANIRQVEHQRAQPGLPLTQTDVFMELETRGQSHIDHLRDVLRSKGFRIVTNEP